MDKHGRPAPPALPALKTAGPAVRRAVPWRPCHGPCCRAVRRAARRAARSRPAAFHGGPAGSERHGWATAARLHQARPARRPGPPWASMLGTAGRACWARRPALLPAAPFLSHLLLLCYPSHPLAPRRAYTSPTPSPVRAGPGQPLAAAPAMRTRFLAMSRAVPSKNLPVPPCRQAGRQKVKTPH
jgi:hypothetical protein